MLEGKRIVVTGASGAIGRAIAIACAERGATLGLGYTRRAEQAESLAREIAALGGVAMPLGFDVTDPVGVEAALEAFTHCHGEVDGWVNNAAVSLPGLLVASEPERIRAQLEVNLWGPIVCTRAVLPRMLRRHAGVVLNVSSVAALRPVRGQSAYAATKGGLEAFTRAIAVEYAKKGIRAVCLRPGAVDTAMLAATRMLGEEELLARIPQGRVAEPHEIGAYAAFLLSDDARYITGTCATIDGGYLEG